MDNLSSKIESILFTAGEPVSVKRLSSVLSESGGVISKKLEDMKNYYSKENRGIDLVLDKAKAQIRTAPKNGNEVSFFIKEDVKELSPAALQTLSVIAYIGPLSKIELDSMRGINSIFTLRSLLIRGLIEKITEDSKVKYRVTIDFLNFFGLSKVSDLTDYGDLRRQMLKN